MFTQRPKQDTNVSISLARGMGCPPVLADDSNSWPKLFIAFKLQANKRTNLLMHVCVEKCLPT